MGGDQRRIGDGADDQLVAHALGIGEAQAAGLSVDGTPSPASRSAQKSERVLTGDPVGDAVDHAGARARPGGRPGTRRR